MSEINTAVSSHTAAQLTNGPAAGGSGSGSVRVRNEAEGGMTKVNADISTEDLKTKLDDGTISKHALPMLVKQGIIDKNELAELVDNGTINNDDLSRILKHEAITAEDLTDLKDRGTISEADVTEITNTANTMIDSILVNNTNNDGFTEVSEDISNEELSAQLKDGSIDKNALTRLMKNGTISEDDLAQLVTNGAVNTDDLSRLFRLQDIDSVSLQDLTDKGAITADQKTSIENQPTTVTAAAGHNFT